MGEIEQGARIAPRPWYQAPDHGVTRLFQVTIGGRRYRVATREGGKTRLMQVGKIAGRACGMSHIPKQGSAHKRAEHHHQGGLRACLKRFRQQGQQREPQRPQHTRPDDFSCFTALQHPCSTR